MSRQVYHHIIDVSIVSTQILKMRHWRLNCIIMNNLQKQTFAKKQLLNATLSLLSTKNIKEISISQITILAQVGRATFYRNFKSIEDILYQYENNLADEFDSYYKSINNKNISTLLYEISKHYLENKEFYTILYKQQLTKIIENTIQNRIKNSIVPQTDIEKYGLSFLSYGLYGWIIAWIKDSMKDSPEKLLTMMKAYYSNPFKIE
ncbi:MAG: TetR/AcrR family transcriptional regulator [Bacilli bacterium]